VAVDEPHAPDVMAEMAADEPHAVAEVAPAEANPVAQAVPGLYHEEDDVPEGDAGDAAFFRTLEEIVKDGDARNPHEIFTDIETIKTVVVQSYGSQILEILNTVSYCSNVKCCNEASLMCVGCLLERRYCFFCVGWYSTKKQRRDSNASSISSTSSTLAIVVPSKNCRQEAHKQQVVTKKQILYVAVF
jgi:hypothetical protein